MIDHAGLIYGLASPQKMLFSGLVRSRYAIRPATRVYEVLPNEIAFRLKRDGQTEADEWSPHLVIAMYVAVERHDATPAGPVVGARSGVTAGETATSLWDCEQRRCKFRGRLVRQWVRILPNSTSYDRSLEH